MPDLSICTENVGISDFHHLLTYYFYSEILHAFFLSEIFVGFLGYSSVIIVVTMYFTQHISCITTEALDLKADLRYPQSVCNSSIGLEGKQAGTCDEGLLFPK